MTHMRKPKETKISYWAAHFTTIVSVTMVLLLVGTIALLGIAASGTAREVKEKQQLSLIMADSVSNRAASALCTTLRLRPYTLSAKLITKEQALAEWNASTGEDVALLAGGNFLSPEIELSLKAPWANPDSIKAISRRLEARGDVAEVVAPDTAMLSGVDNFFSHTLLILGIVALAMIAVSFVLINNTVLLSIYSKRFTIHTMQLVGATSGFIRRPFMLSALWSGLIAAGLACLLLGSALEALEATQLPELARYISWPQAAAVGGGLFIAGGAICLISSLIATGKYLHKDYDELFLA